ncbi:MAG: hypothetical protein A2W05_09325 [Candidatus Schekmanbacteria bacterium RBG_16_38_10]|uniref:DUF3108 domain-containing protein n=1 Tax=Candidatus Schekmanbacteria bacterium RBG_16_38_10 TaxID=1817879 RepID=A0A1F7S1Y5_9BACT|nr:MAG: hypothetical protein A2W05_09325 [Candidatus Schekmanbacteria bacterium RBG_16_38_10]
MNKKAYKILVIFFFIFLFVSLFTPERVFCKQKKLFPLKVGHEFVFNVIDNAENSWEYKINVVGTAVKSLGAKKRLYFKIKSLGYQSPDDVQKGIFVRSTVNAVYIYEGNGKEMLVFKNAPVGTTWTYQDSDGRTMERTIEAKETVIVPAGTFEGCLKFLQKCISCEPPVEFTRQWIKPGFGMVKEIDYHKGENPPRIKELKSWKRK